MSAQQRQAAAKAASAKQSAQARPPLREAEADDEIGTLLGFQNGFGNQVAKRAGDGCPNLAACPTGGACEECRQKPANEREAVPSVIPSAARDLGDGALSRTGTDGTPAQILRSAQDDRGGAPADPSRDFEASPASDYETTSGGESEVTSAVDREVIPAADREIAPGDGREISPAADRESTPGGDGETIPSVIPSAARDLGGEAASEAVAAATERPTTFLVDDPASATDPGQLSKAEFLTELKSQVSSAAERELAGTGRTAADCPWIQYWFGYFEHRSAERVENALRRYAPEAAGARDASDYMPPVVERVRRAVAHWTATGEVTGVPHEGLASLAQAAATTGAMAVPASAASLFFKAREGGARAPRDLQALQARLGEGEALDAPVRSRMESAFGASLGGVRVHRDANAATLSSEVNARAFALGDHVAFGAGEYRPGSVVGDALIAHELAHVVQQQSGGSGGSADYGALEADADRSAAGAVASMWSGAREGLAGMAERTGPALRSGLRLQRCGGEDPRPTPVRPTVDQITIVDSPTGAISGYSDIQGNADLNVPGPFNDATAGECRNTHQIIFHLDAGSSSQLTPSRRAKATVSIGGAEQQFPPDEPNSPGGLSGTRTFDDGPPEHEIKRPDSNRIVVADSPGVQGLSPSSYPFIFKTDFTLTVAGEGRDVARIQYEVRIRKENESDIPNTENQIRATEKKDLVRNLDIT